jgi:hypothetical protein
MRTKTEFYCLFEKLFSEKLEDYQFYLQNQKIFIIINELKGSNKSPREV